MPTYPLPTLGVTLSATGVAAPALTDIINSLVTSLQAIYGSDVVLTPDSQDYQFVAIFATAINDENNAIIAEYLGFMPGYAQGVNLSNLVLINGIQREVTSYSTVTLMLTGVVGFVILAGLVQDTNGYVWALPSNVQIPSAGVIAATATCTTIGAISAGLNTVKYIQNQQVGWQTANNPAAAVPGAPVESDATLRQRQAISTGIAAQTPLSAIAAAVANIAGVSRSKVYENQYGPTDVNGVPGHSIAAVVLGGNLTTVAQTIESKKSPGTGTYGTTAVTVFDPSGVPITINFFQLALIPVYVSVTIKQLFGYVPSTGQALIASIVAFINALPIGGTVYYNWLWAPAQLDDDTNSLGQTYVITNLTIGLAAMPTGTADVVIPFNEAATTTAANVTLVGG